MNSKIILFVFMVTLYSPNHIMAQYTTSKKLERTADNVIKGKKLTDKIFKKKKSKKTMEDSAETAQKDSIDFSKIDSDLKSPVDITAQQPNVFQEVPLTKAATKLFKNCISKTSNAEKNEIAAIMNFHSTPDGTQFLAGDDDYYSQFPFDVLVYPLDINNDDIEEVAIVYGHPAISGDNVISTLFIKDSNGSYIMNFGFNGSLILLPNSTKNFPDIAIGGPGFEFPVWRWNGKVYSNFKKINDSQLTAAKPIYIEEANQRYIEKIKN